MACTLFLGSRTLRVHRGWQLCLERAITTSSSPGRPARTLSRAWNWVRREREEKGPHPLGKAEARGSASASVELTTSDATTTQEPENERRLEKFIPVTRRMLVRKLMEEEGLLNWQERRQMEKLAAAIDAYFSQRFYALLEETKLLYDSLDPDKDTIQSKRMKKKDMLDTEYWLLRKVEKLLDKSNYFKIPPSRLCDMIREHDLEGLRVSVDPKDYDTLIMWTRGKATVASSRLQRLSFAVTGYFSTNSKPPQQVYTRVFVAVRTKSDRKLRLKMFKEVPCNKLEYLLPNGRIMMSKFDKGFLASSVLIGASALAMRSLPVLADKVQWSWIGLGLAALVASRAWIGYKNKRNQYLVNLSRTLYYKAVAHNRGVLTLLADRALDEEFKEAILAYVFLLSPANRRGIPGTEHTADGPTYDSPDSLRVRVNEWLGKVFHMKEFQFDVEDALDKLQTMGLLVECGDGTLTVRGLEETLTILPDPTYHWTTMGALRDVESADEQLEPEIEDSVTMAGGGWK